MVSAREIIQRVLDELESWQSHCVEGKVIGTPGIAQRYGSRSQIPEWLKPFFEKWAAWRRCPAN